MQTIPAAIDLCVQTANTSSMFDVAPFKIRSAALWREDIAYLYKIKYEWTFFMVCVIWEVLYSVITVSKLLPLAHKV